MTDNSVEAQRASLNMTGLVRKDVLSASDLTREQYVALFRGAEAFRQLFPRGSVDIAAGKLLITAFFEPSTRTRLSFAIAMHKLGGQVIDLGVVEATSIMKGETFEDTVRMLDAYEPDLIVLRHKIEGASHMAATIARAPVINAGDGTREHPTQALLDLYTMWRIFGTVEDLKVGFLGDLRHSRVVSSLSYALARFDRNTAYYISPERLRVRRDILERIEGQLRYQVVTDLHEVPEELDVLYVTRVQRERFTDAAEYESARKAYTVDRKLLDSLRRVPVILHPLPRVDELTTEVDVLPQAKYFEQAANGLYVRAALLAAILELKIS